MLEFTAALLAGQAVAQSPEALREKARSVLAQTEGTISVPGLQAPVEVLRDRWGVPHIYAQNQHDLFVAQGFVAAQDRLFQIDLWRRVAVGETAEVIGEKGLDTDRFARLIRYRGNMAAEWESYSPDAREIAEAFVQGINAYIDQIGDKLPIEFQLLGFRPVKWKAEDILGRMSGIVMTRNLKNEILRAHLVATVGAEKARQIAPTDPPRNYGTGELDLAGIDKQVLALYEAATKPLRLGDDDGNSNGSNNWVVDATLSASGKPILASDPHRGIALPSLRYLVHLHAPDWNVVGSGEPALPGIALGHNERIAWGFTIACTDQADLYVEETKSDDPLQYKVDSAWKPMQIVRESIRVRGQSEPVAVELQFTRHGPVIHRDEVRRRAYALRWTGAEAGGAAYLASLAICRAGNWDEFRAAVARWKVPSQNIVYADVEGNIGWHVAGLAPKRHGWDGLLPVSGNGKLEWEGFLSSTEHPQTFNPKKHYIATANHNILPEGYPHPIAYEWAPPYRFRQVSRRIERQSQFTVPDFESIQHDNTTIPGQQIAKLAAGMKPLPPDLEPLRQTLAAWSGELRVESAAGPIYALWLQRMLSEFYRPHVPAELLEFVGSPNGISTMLAVLEQPTEQAGAFWFGENPKQARDAFLARTFAEAIAKGREILGNDLAAWTWGKLHTTPFNHPLASLGKDFAAAFSLEKVPVAGDGLCPNATRHNEKFEQVNGASYRQIFDLADWDRGKATSVPGQSGQPESPHYADLLPLWQKGEYFPLVYSRAAVEKVKKQRLVLKPAP